MKKILVIGLFVAGFAISSHAQSATTPEQKPKENKEMKKDRMEELNLTAAQKEQMKSISMEFREKAKAIKDNTALTEDKKKEQMHDLQKSRREKMKAILTPEQQQKLAEHTRNHKKQHNEKNTSI
jgi:Spy/CpxP family protein refolding chaperone